MASCGRATADTAAAGRRCNALSPGGLLVLEDSAQPTESADMATALHSFPGEFHEPFYNDYLEDDLGELLREVGFGVESTSPQFVAKVVVARRP